MKKETSKKQKTSDALEIMYRHFFEGKPERIAELEKMRADDEVARKIVELRGNAGLSQRQLAKLVGTTVSVIDRLEDADYEGDSLVMLNRIVRSDISYPSAFPQRLVTKYMKYPSWALDRRVKISFVPLLKRTPQLACA